MLRGDVRWFQFAPSDKQRPVLLVTRSSAIPALDKIVAAMITTPIRNVPTEVQLTPAEDGMLRKCVVTFDNLFTIPKRQVGKRITTLSSERMMEVDEALIFALGIE